MIGATPSQIEPKFVALGSGAGTAGITDTTLFTEFTNGTWSGYARSTATGSQVTTSVTNDTAKWVSTAFTAPAGGVAITNTGNFDASTVGNLHIKGDFSVVNLAQNDTMTVTITDQKN